MLTARLPTVDELKTKRNLALNSYDYTNNQTIKSDVTDQYPHISASNEWENAKGEMHFYASIATFEDGTTKEQNITITRTGEEQIFDLDFDKPVTKLQLNNLISDQAGGWATFTEVAVYGTEK